MAGSSLASAVPSAGLISRSRFRGCLLGALLGDCLGGGFESLESVNPAELLHFVRSLQPQDKDEEEEGVAGDKRQLQSPPHLPKMGRDRNKAPCTDLHSMKASEAHPEHRGAPKEAKGKRALRSEIARCRLLLRCTGTKSST
ncbi:UNVERIFIED_CONTAM: hypothetical protein K2H54_048949 [Gekko kuhli]